MLTLSFSRLDHLGVILRLDTDMAARRRLFDSEEGKDEVVEVETGGGRSNGA